MAATGARFKLPLMFIVMAVQAEKLPVAAVGRIVGVIVVAVMNRQFTQVGAGEFPRAAPADPRIEFQRLFPVALAARFGAAASIGEDAVQLARVVRAHGVLGIALIRRPACRFWPP